MSQDLRFEVFCHAIARGNSVFVAAQAAGLPTHRGHLMALSNNKSLRSRIAALRPRYTGARRWGGYNAEAPQPED